MRLRTGGSVIHFTLWDVSRIAPDDYLLCGVHNGGEADSLNGHKSNLLCVC